MDRIQRLVEMQGHISYPRDVQILLNQVNIYWTHMSDEDKDYVHMVHDALEEKREWKI